MQRGHVAAMLAVICGLGGCATTDSGEADLAVGECLETFADFHHHVEVAGVRDASVYLPPRYPYLRTDRFIAALADRLESAKAQEYLLSWMRQLSVESLAKEVSNLAGAADNAFHGTEEQLLGHLEHCSDVLEQYDRRQRGSHAMLRAASRVPDEYSGFMRIVGLYPLVTLPVSHFTRQRREEFLRWFRTGADGLESEGQLTTFVPGNRDRLGPSQVAEILERAAQNPLGVARLSPLNAQRLIGTYAPVFVQDVTKPYDRIGTVLWNAERVDVDAARATVYYYLTHAYFDDRPIVQLNYVIWYTKRAGPNAPRIERGRIDGLTTRISLARDGEVVLVEVMNNCGCYHTLFPPPGFVPADANLSNASVPFIPVARPEDLSDKRLVLRINSGWHQVQGIGSSTALAPGIPYDLVPYAQLEQLPRENGSTASMFSGRGIVKGSQRSERFLLFSMGIPQIGSMRQRGHHAIALIGRAHFDDPYLYRRYFRFD